METGQREYKLRGGKIILYTRADDRHGLWQARLRLGAENKLVRRSTRTTDLSDAKRRAEEIYDDLRYRQSNGKHIKDKTFKQLADDYVRKATRDTVEGRLSKGIHLHKSIQSIVISSLAHTPSPSHQPRLQSI